MKYLLLTILIGGILLLASCGGTPVEQPSPTPNTPPPPAKVIEKKTFDPIVITGSEDKTSPPFVVTTEEWIIDWSYQAIEPEYAIFSFFVYPRGETALYVESVLFADSFSGSTYSYAGSGEYYVKVVAANVDNWEITIKPADK